MFSDAIGGAFNATGFFSFTSAAERKGLKREREQIIREITDVLHGFNILKKAELKAIRDFREARARGATGTKEKDVLRLAQFERVQAGLDVNERVERLRESLKRVNDQLDD